MNILVTGGAGFIGSHIIEALLRDGNEVICLDSFDSYYDPGIKRKNLEHLLQDKNFRLVEGDINNVNLLNNILENVDYIFHEAAQAGVRVSINSPIKPHQANTTGTLNLLTASLNFDVRKIINASSSSVYGEVKYLPFDESHPTNPVSPYGVSKLASEHYCRVFEELYGLRTVSLRYFTVYGPKMRPDLAISIFTKAALTDNEITIFGDGEKTRDFTYIDDIVRANLLAMNRGKGVYNIGGGNRISVRELAEKIVGLTGSSSLIGYTDSIKGDSEHTLADNKKAKKELNWAPKISINEGLMRYAEWISNYQLLYPHMTKRIASSPLIKS